MWRAQVLILLALRGAAAQLAFQTTPGAAPNASTTPAPRNASTTPAQRNASMIWETVHDVTLKLADDGREIKCVNCIYTDHLLRKLTKTNVVGEVTKTLDCDGDSASRAFCDNPSQVTIPYVRPYPDEVCKNMSTTPVCYPEDAMDVTFWSDSQMDYTHLHTADPLRKAGEFLGLYPEDLNLLVRARINVQAHDGGCVLYPLMGMSDMPANLPRYKNYSPYLIMWWGHAEIDQGKRFGWCPSAPSNSGFFAECLGYELVEYMATHTRVDTLAVDDHLRFSLDDRHYTIANVSVPRFIRSQMCCSAPPCTNCDVHEHYRLASYNGKLMARAQYTPFDQRPPGFNFTTPVHRDDSYGGVNQFLPWPQSQFAPTGAVEMSFYFYTSLQAQALYPFVMVFRRQVTDTRFRVAWVDESYDGRTWTVHPHSVAPDMYDAVQQRQWSVISARSKDPNAWRNSNATNTPTLQAFKNTGRNRYLRLTYAWLLGSLAPAGSTVANFLSFATTGRDIYVPLYVLTAQGRGPVKMLVFPSPTGDKDAATVLGLTTRCRQLPTCSVADGASAVAPFDRPLSRRFFRTLMPDFVGECKRFEPNPVTDFLATALPTNAYPLPTCHRLLYSPGEERCYRTVANQYLGPDTVATDALGVAVEYVRQGFSLVASSAQASGPGYPVPVSMMGAPFTHDDTRPRIYLYNEPVLGSLRVGNNWVSHAESCVRDPSVASMIQVPKSTCQCLPFPISPTTCLCAPNGTTFAVTGAVPPGVIFRAPDFFVPVAIPVNYTLVRKQLVYDSGVYTTVNIDCATFLCSNSRKCLEALETSNFMTFCVNQKIILDTTLRSLREGRDEVDRLVDEFVTFNQVDSYADLDRAAQNMPPVLPQPGQAPTQSFNDAFKNYFRTTVAAPVSPPPPDRDLPRESYYRPETTSIEAIGLAFLSQGVGAAILTAKINELNYQNNVQDQKLDYAVEYNNMLAVQLAEVTRNTREVLQGMADTMATIAGGHNRLVANINDRFQRQKDFNLELATRINRLNEDRTADINFLDLVGSRAATMAVQSAAIMVKALDYETRSRRFAQRMRACSSRIAGSINSYECAEVESGIVISTMVRRENTMNLIDNLVLVPNHTVNIFATPEFCYQGVHYAPRESDDVFVLHEEEMMITSRRRWEPRKVARDNTVRMPCADARLVLRDFTPSVPIVDLELLTARGLYKSNLSEIVDYERLSSFYSIPLAYSNISHRIVTLMTDAIESVGTFVNRTLDIAEPPQPVVEQKSSLVLMGVAVVASAVGLLVSVVTTFQSCRRKAVMSKFGI